MQSPLPEEQELIAACKRKEMWAQKKLYEQYASTMMGICIRYVSDRETARDLLQDGFIKVFTKIDTYSGLGSFEGWLRKVFITTALEYLRSSKLVFDNKDIEQYANTIENYDVTVIEKLSADDLMGCIAELPDGFRTVFNLYAIEGYSHAEIAGMLRIKEGTSRSQFARARQILQEKVQKLMRYQYNNVRQV